MAYDVNNTTKAKVGDAALDVGEEFITLPDDKTIRIPKLGIEGSGGKVGRSTGSSGLWVRAVDDTQIFNIAGTLVRSQRTGVGGSVAYNKVVRDTQAILGGSENVQGKNVDVQICSNVSRT